MDKKENRYNNSKIYKLQDQTYGYFYIGSTCDLLSKRFNFHKNKAIIYPGRRVYKTFAEFGWQNIKIILIEEHCLDNKEQLLREEDRIIQLYKQDEKCLNINRAYLSEEEKKQYEHDYKQKYHKLHYEKYKQLVLQTNKVYKQKDPEKWKEYAKQYQAKHSEKITCGCGSIYGCLKKGIHVQCKKHQAWLKGQQQECETI